MYLGLRPPWASRGLAPPPEAPPVVVVAPDAGTPHPKKRRRPRAPIAAGQPAPPGADGELDDPAPAPALTAADRALEWRGDEVALPPRTVDMSGGGEPRSLDDAEIQQTIHGQAGGVRDCVVQGATGTDLSATITAQLLVDGHGRVTRSRIHAPHYLFEHGLLGCAQRALARIRFPAAGGATIVTLPIHLG